jgi:ABC-type oligopeptide transport system substrate-binding subunit
MGKRLTSGVAMLAVGAALLVTAAFAGSARSHGIFRLAVVGPGDTLDPQITYNTLTWSLEYATAAKLFNYPDKSGGAGTRLVPEVAQRYRISKNGRKYTFWIHKGFRFSDGTKVTAKSVAYAFKRALNPQLQSPAASFLRDVRSYKARGRRFIVKLTHADASFITKLALPFFQATSKKLPLNRPVTSGPIPSAGPYYVKSTDPNAKTVIRRNLHYRGPRPHHLKGITALYNQNVETAFEQTLHNQLDEGPLPADQIQSVSNRFHVNRSRFWVKPGVCVGTILLNDRNGLFSGNTAMRKAFNWALDRKAYGAVRAPYTQSPWTQLLSPAVPGVITKRRAQPFTPGPNLAKARKLAAGHFRNGKVTVFYRSSGITGPKQKTVANRVLRQLGFQQSNIKLVGFPGTDIYDAIGRRTDWDLALSVGLCQDSPDAAESVFNFPGEVLPPKYEERLRAIEKLKAPARPIALGRFALRVMKNVAPEAPTNVYNNLYLFSNRVRPRSLVYQHVYTDWDLAAIKLR